MDVPFSALKYVLNPRDRATGESTIRAIRHSGYQEIRSSNGVPSCASITLMMRPRRFYIPSDDLWRVVRFEVTDEGWISWLHEREWRCLGSFMLP